MSIPSSYRYYNRNPNGDILEDCVCRAISSATGLKYSAVEELLVLSAQKYGCDPLCVCCYHRLLEDILKYPRFDCDFTKTVNQIASEHSENILLIRIDAHLTAAIKGTVVDIWNCSDELADCFWIIS